MMFYDEIVFWKHWAQEFGLSDLPILTTEQMGDGTYSPNKCSAALDSVALTNLSATCSSTCRGSALCGPIKNSRYSPESPKHVMQFCIPKLLLLLYHLLMSFPTSSTCLSKSYIPSNVHPQLFLPFVTVLHISCSLRQ